MVGPTGLTAQVKRAEEDVASARAAGEAAREALERALADNQALRGEAERAQEEAARERSEALAAHALLQQVVWIYMYVHARTRAHTRSDSKVRKQVV